MCIGVSLYVCLCDGISSLELELQIVVSHHLCAGIWGLHGMNQLLPFCNMKVCLNTPLTGVIITLVQLLRFSGQKHSPLQNMVI